MKRTPLLAILMVAALGFGGLAYYVSTTPQAQRVPDDLRKPEPAKSSRNRPQVTTSATQTIHLPVVDGDKVTLSKEAVALQPGETVARRLAVAAVVANDQDRNLILGAEIKNGTAIVSLRRSMIGGIGSMQESTLITAWQVAFGQLKDVQKVQIEVDGRPIESLGHFEIDQPLSVVRDGAEVSPDSINP